jgi:CheY-like chemotaxis protein
MGICGSYEVVFVPNDDVPGQDHVAMAVFKQLLLPKYEIDKFYEAFLDIDADSSGFIRADEFRAYFKIESTHFNNRLFGSFDGDGNGFLTFMEFVTSIWNFLSTDTKEVGNFAFFLLVQNNMADENKLNKADLKKILEVIHGKNFARNTGLNEVANEMFSAQSKVSTMKDFLGWCREHPVLISPIVRLQLSMRERIFGNVFWNGLVARRKASLHAKDLGFITELTHDAIQKYDQMEKEIEHKRRNQQLQGLRNRKASIAIIVSRVKRVTQHFQKNSKIASTQQKQDVKKPKRKRARRSYIKLKLKAQSDGIKGINFYDENELQSAKLQTPKKVHSVPSRGLYSLLFDRLVVIDDDYNIGAAAVSTLREMGISTDYVHCQVAADGLQCVENSIIDHRPFEVVFLDGFMPGNNGPTVAEKLRSFGYGGIIIGMCTDEDCVNRDEFISKGANYIISKPLGEAAVRETLMILTPVIGALLEKKKIL